MAPGCKKYPKFCMNFHMTENIFNADETTFFKCLLTKMQAFKGDKCFGGKKSRQRITVLLCASMADEVKVKMLVIGRSKSPRCFKTIKSLEVKYESNKNVLNDV